MLQPAPALQRLIARLPPRVRGRRRAGTDHRDRAAGGDRLRLLGGAVHLCLRGGQRGHDRHAAGSHEPGHFAGGRLWRSGRSGRGGLAGARTQWLSRSTRQSPPEETAAHSPALGQADGALPLFGKQGGRTVEGISTAGIEMASRVTVGLMIAIAGCIGAPEASLRRTTRSRRPDMQPQTRMGRGPRYQTSRSLNRRPILQRHTSNAGSQFPRPLDAVEQHRRRGPDAARLHHEGHDIVLFCFAGLASSPRTQRHRSPRAPT